MNRKNFIGTILPMGLSASGLAQLPIDKIYLVISEVPGKRLPPYLKKGDTIGITCPAGYISMEDIQPAVNKMQEWGYRIRIGDAIGKKDFILGGTDAERLADLQQMLDDRNIKAIMCARGGYGAVRIIDKINFDKYLLNPKWIIGFSDITVLHSHINRHFNIATIHSKMCNSFPSDWNLAEQIQRDTIESIGQCLSGKKMEYSVVPNANNKTGNASGTLVGGNLKTLETLAGSSSDLITKNKILFVEDTGEYLYSIDRMFWNLKRTGKLSQLKGLIIGGFKMKPDDPGEEFGKTLEQIVLEKIIGYNYPVCFDFPVGHQKNNYALKCGMIYNLTVSEKTVSLKEI
ncbi:MAG: LD-carboxypeptidase [Ferruginibacter sp.]